MLTVISANEKRILRCQVHLAARYSPHLQAQMADRVAFQADKAELPAKVLLRREQQCHQDPDLGHADSIPADDTTSTEFLPDSKKQQYYCVMPKTRKACNSPELHAFHLIMYSNFYKGLLHLLEIDVSDVIVILRTLVVLWSLLSSERTLWTALCSGVLIHLL